jgi:hypothetical protein
MADREHRKQAPRKAFRESAAFLPAIAFAIVLAAALSACGKKPSSVDPPPDVTEDHFPRTYPDPATDPKP